MARAIRQEPRIQRTRVDCMACSWSMQSDNYARDTILEGAREHCSMQSHRVIVHERTSIEYRPDGPLNNV